jgi:nicotinamidase-related amidase
MISLERFTRSVVLTAFAGAILPLLLAADSAKDRALNLVLRDRVGSSTNSGQYEIRERSEEWQPRQTAIIICDMWDLHHCKRAVERVQEMAPRMNEVITKARNQSIFIIHAPSECMAAYENSPMRQRAKNALHATNLPKDIGAGCNRIPSEDKGRYPIDQSDGGEDDERAEHAAWAAKLAALGRNPRAPWKTEIDVLKMEPQDAISDSGVEIWNLLEERGIKNVILMGVHTNMCVLGRPFGLRQMAKNGKHVVLMRDLTDTMYNPARWPYVNHFRGTDLIVEHIEKFVCPTITSNQILGGEPFHFKNDVTVNGARTAK